MSPNKNMLTFTLQSPPSFTSDVLAWLPTVPAMLNS